MFCEVVQPEFPIPFAKVYVLNTDRAHRLFHFISSRCNAHVLSFLQCSTPTALASEVKQEPPDYSALQDIFAEVPREREE